MKSTDIGTPAPDALLEAWRQAGIGAQDQLAAAAKRISEQGFGGKSGLVEAMEKLVRDAKTPMSEAVRAMNDQWQERAVQLRKIRTDSLNVGPLLASLPSAEVSASRAIEAQTARLVEISIRTSEQIGQLAQLAEDALAQQIQAVLTAAQMREDAKGSSRNMTWLTVAIVILTAVLVAIALKLGPFAGA